MHACMHACMYASVSKRANHLVGFLAHSISLRWVISSSPEAARALRRPVQLISTRAEEENATRPALAGNKCGTSVAAVVPERLVLSLYLYGSPINQSINQSFNQSISQSVSQSVCENRSREHANTWRYMPLGVETRPGSRPSCSSSSRRRRKHSDRPAVHSADIRMLHCRHCRDRSSLGQRMPSAIGTLALPKLLILCYVYFIIILRTDGSSQNIVWHSFIICRRRRGLITS